MGDVAMRVIVWLAVSLAVVVLPARWGATQSYDSMYVFGDILSDQGNELIASGIEQLPPPLYGTTPKDGPVALERLGALLNVELAPSRHLVGRAVGTNYAVAGATTTGDDPRSLPAQIDAFLASVGSDPDGLYVVYIGATEIAAAAPMVDEDAANQLVIGAANGAAASVDRLVRAGARHVLALKLPSIGEAPFIAQAGLAARAAALTNTYNRRLEAGLRHVESAHPDLRIVVFDTHAIQSEISSNARGMGFRFTDRSCLPDLLPVLLGGEPVFDPECEGGTRASEFVFFSDMVLSAHFEERVARALYGIIPDVAPRVQPLPELDADLIFHWESPSYGPIASQVEILESNLGKALLIKDEKTGSFVYRTVEPVLDPSVRIGDPGAGFIVIAEDPFLSGNPSYFAKPLGDGTREYDGRAVATHVFLLGYASLDVASVSIGFDQGRLIIFFDDDPGFADIPSLRFRIRTAG
jgi:hypothetical protein